MENENLNPDSGAVEKIQKENKLMKVALIGLSVLLLAALAVVLFFVISNGYKPTDGGETEPPTSVSTNYTAADEQAVAAAGQVVAHMGQKQLTNSQLQTYYCMAVYQFLQEEGMYVSYYGLDLTKPLGEQVYDATTGQTWEDVFLEQALNTWNRYAVLEMMGEDAGYALTQESQEALDSLEAEMVTVAESMEYASVEEMIAAEMGASCTLESYMSYMRTNYYCADYFNQLYETLEPTMDEIEAYYTENEETFVSAGYGKEVGKAVDVRHILLIPEGGEAIEGSNYKKYTDEAWEACRVAAQAILDTYLAGDKTETSFANLAIQHSADGSASNGGLISNVVKGKTVQAFNDWIFDESRQYGDYGLVRTEYGYHVMFFVDIEELWIRTAKNMVISDKATALIDEAVEANPMEVNMDLIKLSQLSF